MKKKTNRQKRTLIGAVCVAAVIMAGSTFAWFTSSDEVTNRLTANADYEVSIVESFAPPANWIPGMKVEKDVYAVNTGNIAAFVNEDISGVMSVTYEIQSDTFVSSSAVKLNDTEVAKLIDGATAQEGGAFLAYTTTSTPTGYLVSSRTDDNLTSAWHPTEAGIYIFRRSISLTPGGTETYDYAGYYFDGNDYYKIAIIPTVADGSNPATPTVIPDSEGKLSAVTYKYVLDLQETAQSVGMYYDAANTRLVATYALNPAANFPYDAEALAARKQVDLNNATAAQTTANANYNNANAALTAINDLIQARNNVVEKAIELNNVINAKAEAGQAVTDANTAVTGAVDAIIVPNLGSAVEEDNTTTYTGSIKTSVEKYNGLIGTVNTDIESLNNALTALKNADAPRSTATAQSALTTLQTSADNLWKAYAEIKDAGAAYDTDGTIKTAIKNFRTAVNSLSLTALNEAVDNYNEAVTNNTGTDAADGTDYNSALGTYSTKLAAVPTGVDTSGYTVNNVTNYADTDDAKTAVAANAALSPSQLALETADSYSYTVGAKAKTVSEWKAISDAADGNYTLIDGRSTAVPSSDKTIDIYINLDPSFASYWEIEDDVKTKASSGTQETQDKVSFFLKHILDEGKTSEKLIDSLVLSPDTENVFKSFTFDLNVHLDSAQVTYDDDQRTMTADAVQAPAFEEAPNPDSDLTLNSVLTWNKRTNP